MVLVVHEVCLCWELISADSITNLQPTQHLGSVLGQQRRRNPHYQILGQQLGFVQDRYLGNVNQDQIKSSLYIPFGIGSSSSATSWARLFCPFIILSRDMEFEKIWGDDCLLFRKSLQLRWCLSRISGSTPQLLRPQRNTNDFSGMYADHNLKSGGHRVLGYWQEIRVIRHWSLDGGEWDLASQTRRKVKFITPNESFKGLWIPPSLLVVGTSLKDVSRYMMDISTSVAYSPCTSLSSHLTTIKSTIAEYPYACGSQKLALETRSRGILSSLSFPNIA